MQSASIVVLAKPSSALRGTLNGADYPRRVHCSLFERLQKSLEPGQLAQSIEIGIVLDPDAIGHPGEHGALEQIHGQLKLVWSCLSVQAADVVEHRGLIRLERQRPLSPFERLAQTTELQERAGTEVERTHVARIELERAARTSKAALRRRELLFAPTERAIGL